MSKQIHVDFDKDANKFVIQCPFWANDLVKNLPTARWNKSARAWHAPVTRKNAEGIELSMGPYAEMTDAAKDAIARAKKAKEVIHTGDQFPFWYTWKTKPEPYQEKCLHKLFPLKASAIFSGMGTGKSKMAIDFAAAKRMDGKIDAMLIVCKLTLRENWIAQFNMHCPIPASIHLPDTTRKKEFQKWMASSHDFKVLIVGTESLSAGGMAKIAESFMMTAGKVLMCVDESHYIASHDATRAEVCVRLGRQAEYRIAMTGTPLREGPLNLFMQFEYLDPDVIGIGDWYAFRNRYAVMGGYRDPKTGKPMQIVGYQNVDELAETVAPYVYQISKEEANLNIPPKVPQIRTITMTKEQRALYDEIRKTESYTVDGEEQVMQTVLETCLRLHQVCGGHAVKMREVEKTIKGEKRIKRVYDPYEVIPWKDNPKIKEINDILDENKDPAIFWCAYKPEIEALVKMFKHRGLEKQVALYHGGINAEDRDRYDKGYQDGTFKYMLSNQQTGGEGLTWIQAQLVVYYSNTNKMLERLQSEDRAHRRGQKNTVNYIDLIMENSIDKTIWYSNGQKMDLAEFVRQRINNASAIQDIYNGRV